MNNLTIAITKIGDLLIHDTVTKTESGNPLPDVFLTVPEYQRPYKWTAKNANQLLDDILEALNGNKEVYRVGTLILYRNGSAYEIVDGLQRTITFSLLLESLGCGEIAFLNQKLAENYFNAHNVSNNYRALRRRVENLADSEKKRLAEYIENNCELIVVITDMLSEAFQFFDSQNARGKKLYPHDLLKAFHLREMRSFGAEETEKIIKTWEELDQKLLSNLFSEYLYRVKVWVKGNRAEELDEHNIDMFKGVSANDNYPYAQYFKGAFSYAELINHSAMPFVSGIRNLKPFQIDAPIIAGKPFFDYAKNYYDILEDIQNNDKYSGYYINDNAIVKTLDLRKYKSGIGNRISRLLFDTAILLYVDRFCPERPQRKDNEMLEQFVVFAFIWAYSLRAQYTNVGWQVAHNHIAGIGRDNSFNIYKIIAEADSPESLFGTLADKIMPIPFNKIPDNQKRDFNKIIDGIPQNFLDYFSKYNFLFMGDNKK